MKKIFTRFFGKSSNSITRDFADNGQDEFIWCLVGNISSDPFSEETGATNYGTKHFLPKAKVYCFPTLWGDGYEKIKVIGRHRKTSRNVCIIMPSKLITNWRLQKVYRPYILNVMKTQRGWTNRESDKQRILEMLKWLPEKYARDSG